MRTHTTLRFADAQLSTGVRLRYAERGDPAGRPVVMLHGVTDSWFSFSRVLPLLDASLRAIAIDQRGHGDSERPDGGYALKDLAADVVSFMDAMELGSAVLVGHSMGSHVAQRVALAAPERVDAVVLVGSATTLRNDDVLEFAREVSALADPVPEEFVRAFQESTVHVPVPGEFMDAVVAESLKLPVRVWRALMAGMLIEPGPVALGRIEAPALVIGTDRDAFCPLAEQEALAAQIPNASLKVYAETGHTPHWEWPERFTRDLEDFIARAARPLRVVTSRPAWADARVL